MPGVKGVNEKREAVDLKIQTLTSTSPVVIVTLKKGEKKGILKNNKYN